MTHDRAVFARARPWLGWLVVAGGVPANQTELSGICDRLLDKADPSLPAVWIDPEATPNPGVERMMEDIDLLLEVPVERLAPGEDLPVGSVGLILIAGGDPECWLNSLGSGATGAWVARQLDEGSVVFAGGAAAAALGDRVFPDEAGPGGHSGLGWLPGGVLLPGMTDPSTAPHVRRYLSKTTHGYALGLPEGTAIAIGPLGQVEVWSDEPPKLVLGKGWMPE